MAKPEYVYAIRVMTTKKGKPRKRKAWARCRGWVDGWDAKTCSMFGVITAHFIKTSQCTKQISQSAMNAESALGCKCKVVKIKLEEVDDGENEQ